MVNASKRAGLGQTLNRAQKQANQRRNPRKSVKHTVEEVEPTQDRSNLRSVTAQTNLDEFFEEVELAGRQFVTERRNLAVIDGDSKTDLYTQHEKVAIEAKLNDIEIGDTLTVPRRPKWDSTTTPEQLDELERLSFLAWRRKLARLQEQEDVSLTPFEKNLEVWRQLWRVIERSDIVVQILDCRNPLLYLCEDLIKYVNEAFDRRKMNMILLNKADFLTIEQRRMWSEYFKKRNIRAIFFSALFDNDCLKRLNQINSTGQVADAQRELDPNSADPKKEVSENDEDNVSKKLETNLTLDDDAHIYDKFELLDTWKELLDKMERSQISDVPEKKPTSESEKSIHSEQHSDCGSTRHHRPTVGLVGYPNVGKSSTINVLLSAKRVAVSATPGKTKHFQTFLIDRDMMLCDCPGLVFPNFVSSKAEMVINGILPIDQMKDCISPVRKIVEKIPKAFLEEIYGLAFEQDAKQNLTAEDLLNAFGFMRGYMTARGLPDVSRASRVICKDYINGKIIYCEPPPDADRKHYQRHSKLEEAMRSINERSKDVNNALRITERQKRLMSQAKGTDISSREFDAKYFQFRGNGVHVKGLPGIGNMTKPIGTVDGVKLPKREKKHKKREKLRRVHRDLDI